MDTIKLNGRRYSVTIEADDTSDTPWERDDGHGPVSDWTTRDKRPGELVLNQDGRSFRYYDFAEACVVARRDWLGPNASRKDAAKAARDDFDRLHAWCNDGWHYVGVVVRPICPHCGHAKENDYRFALWGIESDAGDYLDEVARELAGDAEAELSESCAAGCA